ncbi:MAG: methyltransferase domain-containing protein [Desulfobacterales bacterium]|jgi:ubiquinone/menaquinone biosynthesis C-methylase UbiE|nr:methyltransferase domain-containing protein [Desulfobacterales bacterium]
MTARDIYRFINEQDDNTIQRIIDRLEFRGQDPTFAGWLDAYLNKLRLTPSAQVLMLGCGSGVEVRKLAGRSDFTGKVVGVDISPALIEAARRFAVEEGVDKNVEFQVGDAHGLEYADDSFDVVIAHTLMSHLANPLAVIKEAARIVRPNCQIAIFDGDYASWTFGYSDPDFAKAMDETLIGFIVNNPRVMRTIPRLLSQAALTLEETIPHIFTEVGTGSFFLGAAETYAPLIAQAGLLPADQVENWLAEQRKNNEKGTFFASGNYYAYLARRV